MLSYRSGPVEILRGEEEPATRCCTWPAPVDEFRLARAIAAADAEALWDVPALSCLLVVEGRGALDGCCVAKGDVLFSAEEKRSVRVAAKAGHAPLVVYMCSPNTGATERVG